MKAVDDKLDIVLNTFKVNSEDTVTMLCHSIFNIVLFIKTLKVYLPARLTNIRAIISHVFQVCTVLYENYMMNSVDDDLETVSNVS